MTKFSSILFNLSATDDGYRVRDWFQGGAATLDEAREAASAEEADAILRAAYLGPDVDGVTVEWGIVMQVDGVDITAGTRIAAGKGVDRDEGIVVDIIGTDLVVSWTGGACRTRQNIAALEDLTIL